ncbi:MAG: hypothetical protein PHH98_00700 [Candidatus Gracilibacteria bacterium]|nr:hypothetical protein [Candidatus Gracilibacteria bacterium]
MDLLFKFGKYGITKEAWDLGEKKSSINTISCGFYIANFFFNLGMKNLGIIFMNTTYQDCYDRILKHLP